MTIAVECPRCGHPYQPGKAAIIAGVWRRACPVCYPPDELVEPKKEKDEPFERRKDVA